MLFLIKEIAFAHRLDATFDSSVIRFCFKFYFVEVLKDC